MKNSHKYLKKICVKKKKICCPKDSNPLFCSRLKQHNWKNYKDEKETLFTAWSVDFLMKTNTKIDRESHSISIFTSQPLFCFWVCILISHVLQCLTFLPLTGLWRNSILKKSLFMSVNVYFDQYHWYNILTDTL